MNSKKKLAILGNGHLAGIIVDAWEQGFLDDYELIGIMGRTKEKTEALAERGRCRACSTIEELLANHPDYVAEACSVKAVKDYSLTILSSGANMIVLSIGAFADDAFYNEVSTCASDYGTRVYIASGAIGGFDVLRTVALMGEARVKFRTKKGPESLTGTPVFKKCLLKDKKKSRVFSGTAKEAIGLLPTKVNVAVAASLATVGPDNTSMRIYSVPGMAGDDHKITAEIEGVKAVVDIYSRTSDIAGWSIVAQLRNLASPIVF